MANRDYLIGETITLRVAVNEPGTRKPVDPTNVVLSSVKRGTTVVTLDQTVFTKRTTGDYELIIDTSDLTAGIYDFVVTVSGPAGVVILPDKFTLKAP